MKEETSKTLEFGEMNVKAEYRLDKDNWSFKPIGDAESESCIVNL